MRDSIRQNKRIRQHGRLARWRKWKSCDVREAKEGLENELCSFLKLCHFTYVSAHSPTLPSLYLRHSSYSNPSVASPTSQFILQPFFRFSYVTRFSLTSPGEPPMLDSWVCDRYVDARGRNEQVTTRTLQEWWLAASNQYLSHTFEFITSDSWAIAFRKKVTISDNAKW